MNCAWTVVHTTRRKIHTASMVAWTPCGFSKAVQWTSNEGPMKVQRRSRAQGGVSPGDRSERSPPSTNRRASRLAGTHSAPFAPPPPSGRKHRMTQHVTTAIITVMHARRIKRTAPSDIPTDDTVHTAPHPSHPSHRAFVLSGVIYRMAPCCFGASVWRVVGTACWRSTIGWCTLHVVRRDRGRAGRRLHRTWELPWWRCAQR